MKRWILCAILALFALSGCAAQTGAPQEPEIAESAALSELDRFYQNPLTEPYGDIRALPPDYTRVEAQADRCFVIGAMVHNDDLYADFMARVENHTDAFIRVAQDTVEGDTILYDILYDSASDRVLLVVDATRDAFGGDESAEITLRSYDAVAEYDDGRNLLWIAYRGALEDVDLQSEDAFVLAVIN